jgi:C1A family cysteine protease
LSEGYPVVFGFTVYSEVWDKCGDIGILQLPQPGDHRAGAHCVTIYGHDDSEHMFTVKNQYGPGWGDKGYFLMNYGYVESRDLSDDFWTVRIAQ